MNNVMRCDSDDVGEAKPALPLPVDEEGVDEVTGDMVLDGRRAEQTGVGPTSERGGRGLTK